MDLRPLSLGELLDRAFTLYRRHFWLFVGVMAVPAVFALALGLISTWFQHSALVASASPGAAQTIETAVMMAGLFAAMMVALVAYLVVYMIAVGATSFGVSELYVGRSVTIGSVYRRMRGRVGRLLLLMLLIMIRVGGIGVASVAIVTVSAVIAAGGAPVLAAVLMAAAMIAGTCLFVFLMLRYGVAVPALVLEDLTASNAIRRSIQLTKGNRWRVLLMGICAVIVSYAGIALFQLPFSFAAAYAGPETSRGFLLNMAGVVFGTIGNTFTGPILIVGLALLYYDTRIRHEALDLDLMIDALDRKGPRTEPARA
jgi:hypothetical protein